MRRTVPKFTVYRLYIHDGPLVSMFDAGPAGKGYSRREALGLAKMHRHRFGPRSVYARGSKS